MVSSEDKGRSRPTEIREMWWHSIFVFVIVTGSSYKLNFRVLSHTTKKFHCMIVFLEYPVDENNDK